jgi:propionate CoA-transferase
VTAKRSAADEALARLAATTLAENVPRGAYVNIGVGLPEEVAHVVFESGALDRVTFAVESGPLGGLPAPGVYFGASFSPERMLSSAEMFKLCYRRLDATCLGVLQADGNGNVNVSRRGDGPRNYVGPGGFIDLSTAARTVIFVSAWMAHGEVSVEGGKLRVRKRGRPKFVERVDEITFNGRRALAAGKKVFFATHVGLFRLTGAGMELAAVMPGVDVRRDVLDFAPMKIVLPRSGQVPLVPTAVVTGDGFSLRFAARRPAAGRAPSKGRPVRRQRRA